MKNNVKKFRQAKGLRQADLAKEIGSTDRTISRIETGKGDCSLELAIRIARSLGKHVEEVFEV